MRHNRYQTRQTHPSGPTATANQLAPRITVANVEVFDRTSTGWPMTVTFTNGTSLPSTLHEPRLLADFLSYYGLSENVVSFHGRARQQLARDGAREEIAEVLTDSVPAPRAHHDAFLNA